MLNEHQNVFSDAIKEGDGECILECWHYMLPFLHKQRSFLFVCQHLFDLPPQQAEQMLYSRFINTVELDLHQEHAPQ